MKENSKKSRKLKLLKSLTLILICVALILYVSTTTNLSQTALEDEGEFQVFNVDSSLLDTQKSKHSSLISDYTNIQEPSFKKTKELPINNEIEVIENLVKLVSEEPISTFSADVDDGSYKLFKREVQRNNDIHPSIIRVEEFINAFQYNSYKQAISQEKPFSTDIKIMSSPWSNNYLMLIGIKGYEYNINNLPHVNLTFLVDVSGSMSDQMGKIKTSLKMLIDKLRPEDRISLVTYAGSTRTVLKNTPISKKIEIKSAIDNLSSGGGTNGASGINLAYKETESGFIKDGINRILLISDGDFNVGITGTMNLKELIKEKRKTGITFSTIGIGGNNYQDQEMEQMANVGNGQYTFIDDLNDAQTVFSERFISTLKNVAKDVKYQVEFNKNNVKEYRLLGYENRMLNKEDFNNDLIDAGELPSGSTTTAIYEITLSDQQGLYPESRYSEKEKVDTKDFSNELAFLKIRYKQPSGSKSSLLEFPIDKNILNKNISKDNIFAVHAAGFAQLLKNSDYIGKDYNYEKILNILNDFELDRDKEDFRNLVELIKSK